MMFCGGSTPLANEFVQPYLSPQASLAQYAAWLEERVAQEDVAVLTQLAGIKSADEIVSGATGAYDHGPLVAQVWQRLQAQGGLRPRARVHMTGERPKAGQVWVFAANLAGQLSTSGAQLAKAHYGAQAGRWGYQGQAPAHSYALPTKDAKRNPLSVEQFAPHLSELMNFIHAHPELRFCFERFSSDAAQEAACLQALRRVDLNRCTLPPTWVNSLCPPAMAYAGVGDPQTPDDIQRQMQRIAARLAHLGLRLRTTPMAGAHSAWLAGTIAATSLGSQPVRERRELYLPWPSYAHQPQATVSSPTRQAESVARVIYPAYGTHDSAQRAVLATHIHLVLGADLHQPIDLLVCWTAEGAQTQAQADTSTPTGIAIGVAQRWNIPVFNLQRPGRVAELFAYLHEQGWAKAQPLSKWMMHIGP